MKMLKQLLLPLSNLRTRWLILMALFPLILGACHWHHHNAPGHHSKMIEKGMSVVSYKLNFDQQQKQLLAELTSEIKLIRDEASIMHRHREAELLKLLNDETLDTEAIKKMLHEHRANFDLFYPRVMPSLEKLHASLTDAQKEKIEKGVRGRFGKHYSG